MVAQVQRAAQQVAEPAQRVVLAHVDAVGAQVVEVARGRAERAEAVVEDVDPHAGLRARDQAARELLARPLGLEDVALEVDVVMRVGDGLEHRGVGARAVLQQVDAVARDQRFAQAGDQRVGVAVHGHQWRRLAGHELRRRRQPERDGRGHGHFLPGFGCARRRALPQAGTFILATPVPDRIARRWESARRRSAVETGEVRGTVVA